MTALQRFHLVELSTAHLSLSTRQWLDSPAAASHRPSVLTREYGWMIWTGSVDFDPGELPPDLHLCLRFARANGAHWLLIDQDADEREDLPMYEDDDVICRQLPWGDERVATASWLPGLSGHQIVTWAGNTVQGWPWRAQPIEAIAHHTVQDSGLVVGS